MATGTAMIGLGLLAGSLISQLWQLCIVFALIGSGLMCSTAIPCSLVISNWFTSRRGTAMGVAVAGTSVGGMVLSPVANWIILSWSWRAAFVFSGITIVVLTVPVIFLVIRTHPSEIGTEPYRRAETDGEGDGETWGVTLRGAFSLPVFYLFAVLMLAAALVAALLKASPQPILTPAPALEPGDLT